MKTFVHYWDRKDYINPSSSVPITGGSVVVLNTGNAGYVGIAIDTIPPLATGALEVAHVQSLPKNTGEAFTDGQPLYWTGTVLTGTASTNTWAGRSDGAWASAATVANVNLNVK